MLTHDFENFILGVRPTFVVLQIAECLGVGEAAVAAASSRLTGVNVTFADDVAAVATDLDDIAARQENIITRVGSGQSVTPVELLELRLDAASAAVAASGIEVRVAGGAVTPRVPQHPGVSVKLPSSLYNHPPSLNYVGNSPKPVVKK